MPTPNRAIAAAAVLIMSLLTPSRGASQDKPSASDQQQKIIAYFCENRDMFDFLLGEWSFVGTRGPRQIQGVWTFVKSPDGPLVLDEFRMQDTAGRTAYVSTTVRVLSPAEMRWNIVGLEPGTGLPQLGTAWKEGSDVRIDQTFNSPGPDGVTGALWRIRYYDIQPDRFSWRADRSRDGGRTWETPVMTMDVRRTGPPRRYELTAGEPIVYPCPGS